MIDQPNSLVIELPLVIQTPLQEIPIEKGTFVAQKNQIQFLVKSLKLIIKYDNVISFGKNKLDLIIFIRDDKEINNQDDEEEEFPDLTIINEISESLRKNIQYTVNFVGPFKIFVKFDDHDQQTLQNAYNMLIKFSQMNQGPEAEYNFNLGNKQHFELMGNMITQMIEDNEQDMFMQDDGKNQQYD